MPLQKKKKKQKKNRKVQKKTKSNLNFLKRTAVLSALIAASYLTFHFLSRNDLSDLSIQVDNSLKTVLAENGALQSDITKSFQTEKKNSSSKWIQFSKKIMLEKNKIDQVLADLEKEISDIDRVSIVKEDLPDSVKINILSGSILLSSLELIPKRSGHKLAIIVDDTGYSKNIQHYMELDIPLTYAIIPGTKYSKLLAQEFSASGIPYIIHMPMEAENYPVEKLGNIKLTVGMSRKEMQDNIEKAIRSVPGARGMNNHMGSKFTSDEKSVSILVKILKEKDMFFVDSRTYPKTVAYKKALELGVPTAINDFFLDNKNDFTYVRGRLDLLKEKVRKNESTIAICHMTRKKTAEALLDFLSSRKNDLNFVPVKELLK